MNGKKVLLLGSLILLLLAIPLTVYFAGQQQQTQTQAQKSTTLCLAASSPTNTACATAPIAKNPGETFSVDVIMNPGSNQVSTVRLNLTFDATKIATTGAGITPNAQAVSPLTETVYGTGNATARLGIVVNPGVGVDPTKTLSQVTKIATIEFKVLDTATAGSTQIAFGQTLVLSSNPQDGQDEDVLSSATPLTITVGASTAGPPSAPGTGQAPSCTALNVDRTTSGTSPFSITFTANGRDTDGTISKATFDFGDGPVQDVVSGGGIGTNSVSVQLAHTYNNPGTFQAKVTLTDNSNAISSSSASCSQTITVTQSSGGQTATASATPIVIAAATPTPNVPSPTIENPGPSENIVGIGLAGVVLSVIGGLLFFSF